MTDPAPTVRARLDALDALDAIRELPARYAAAYARLDVDALVALYAPDVPLATGLRGRAAMHAHFTAGIRGDGPGAGLQVIILHTGTHVVERDGPDSARGTVYCHGEMQRRDGSWYHQAIVYTDTYTRAEGVWLFAAQRVHELVYGAPPGTRPNHLPDAHWPRSQVGRGTLPDRWPSWSAFWEPGKGTDPPGGAG
jgi:ketosteroid isomerase-like protein